MIKMTREVASSISPEDLADEVKDFLEEQGFKYDIARGLYAHPNGYTCTVTKIGESPTPGKPGRTTTTYKISLIGPEGKPASRMH